MKPKMATATADKMFLTIGFFNTVTFIIGYYLILIKSSIIREKFANANFWRRRRESNVTRKLALPGASPLGRPPMDIGGLYPKNLEKFFPQTPWVRIPIPTPQHQKTPYEGVFQNWRRRRDSNPRSRFSGTRDFQSRALGQLCDSSKGQFMVYG